MVRSGPCQGSALLSWHRLGTEGTVIAVNMRGMYIKPMHEHMSSPRVILFLLCDMWDVFTENAEKQNSVLFNFSV